MAQIVENILRKNNICPTAVANREVSLSTLRSIVKNDGQSFEVFQKMVQMRS
ncbi:MAG: hypothetical protein H6696_09370 [Deferribacteres bacterium]|nr:hypothetical protein [candidate division KSB1 bacterium]MCB9502136.1 hypothetical protein [Deferribacteres bacterium]